MTYKCAEGGDAVVTITEWEQFRGVDLSKLQSVMKQAILADLRRIYRPEDAARHRFTYRAIGLHTSMRTFATTRP
jgi:UDPglucose 6-dehydrogenase